MKILEFLGKGVAHEDMDKECQDRLSCIETADGRTILAVSDGCSSSEFAQKAAECNIGVINKIYSRFSLKQLNRDSFIELYPEAAQSFSRFEKDDLASCFEFAFRYELFKLAASLRPKGVGSRDLCATLLFAVIEKDQTAVGHIGDGNVIFFDDKGRTVFRSDEENGATSSHTYFTLSADFTDHFRYDIIPTESYSGVMLFSDGPQSMFRMERGSIEKGAYEIVMKPIFDREIVNRAQLTAALQKSLANAMHYGFDDWSIIAAAKSVGESAELTPVSLKELFMETFGENSSDSLMEAPTVVYDKDTKKSGKRRGFIIRLRPSDIRRKKKTKMGIRDCNVTAPVELKEDASDE